MAPKAKRSAKAKPTIETPPDWAFDVTGTYEIDASDLHHDISWFKREHGDNLPKFLMQIQYANNPAHKRIGRQLWANFYWGNIHGCLRFCPGHKYCSTHVQFEEGCILEPGVWPGPSPRGKPIWNFRWRAMDGAEILEGTDEWETQVEFNQDSDGKMKIAGKMVVGGYKARKFSGIKHSPAVRDSSDTSVEIFWKSFQDPFAESKYELCRSCKGKIDDSDEEKTPPRTQIDWDAKRREEEEAERKRKENRERPWDTEMTGEYKITAKQSFMQDKDPTAPWWMKIYCKETRGRRQYYANFQFGHEWSGIMRFCPGDPYNDIEAREELPVEEFEKACILEPGMVAGPSPHGVNDWIVKWRGVIKADDPPGPTDNSSADISFKMGEEGKLVLSGVLIKGYTSGILFFFEGVKTGDLDARGPNEPTLETLWEKQKFVPAGQPTPKLWPWKSPMPSTCIESPPAWAWDVLGKWKITSASLTDAFELSLDTPLNLHIHMVNSTKPQELKKLGRQLWAQFSFGPITGCMRFCPLPPSSRPADTLEIFEKQCKLKKGVWPGYSSSAKGKSFQEWGHRWRGRNSETGERYELSDDYEHMLEFEREGNGTLKIGGVFGTPIMLVPWDAVKVEDEVDPVFSTENPTDVWGEYNSN